MNNKHKNLEENPSPKHKAKTKEFAENYQKLQTIADHLKNAQFLDLDQVLPMIKAASAAYAKCRSRLDAVQAALNSHFASKD